MAQFGRALRSGRRGRRFKSCRAECENGCREAFIFVFKMIRKTGEDYERRNEIFDKLVKAFEKVRKDRSRKPWRRYFAAFGMTEFEDTDINFDVVFKRADEQMYENKSAMKAVRRD